ncbi:ABC transporter permease [Rubrobacter xylanophilus]|uniref:ABC transporter permease n=1 Tax=Rubrobacter xylanophilus TaxID=49319 RepID=UPI001C644158|nr:ABC transporter permease [Rubrobacter xylanophilus]
MAGRLPKFSVLPFILAALWGVVFLFDSTFLTFGNLTNLFRQTAIIGVLAIGQTIVIITKGIDLSVGSVLAFTNIIMAQLLASGVPLPLAILAVVGIGALIGMLNGALVYDAGITPFIATLGTLTIFRGATLVASDAKIVTGLPPTLPQMAYTNVLGIPVLVYVLFFLALIGAVIVRYTVFGRNLFSVGSNLEAARLSGVNVRLTLYGAYVFSGVLAAVAGILSVARLASGVPTAGEGYELDSIAAAVIGGASLFGAQGSVVGTVIGATIMSTLRNAGNLLGIQPFYLQIAIGIVLLAVVFFDQIQKRRRS